jgi:hypothetical protein
MCGGLDGGIDGVIHAAHAMWDMHHIEEYWVFLPIDARNTFNELDRMTMLLNVQHGWPSGARFMFNSYNHWASLVIRKNDSTGELLFRRQGLTRGDSLSMFGYALGLVLLTLQLKTEFP